jgi:hypothetical protein
MKLKQLLFCLVLVVNTIDLSAQTGIGTTTPHPSAKLEVSATNKGFLPPRIALLSTTDVATVTSPATGLVVYNTNTAGSSPNAVVPGYYYWDGLKWNGLVDQGALQSFSGYVPNYAQSNANSVTRSAIGDIVVSQSITTSGRPIQIIATGDANPQSAGAWVQLQLFRDGTAIGKKLQVESSAANENIPYCINFIDNPAAGTYTYSVKLTSGGVSFQFGEADGNQITLLELGAWSSGTVPVSKGGTGNSSYTTGSLLFSDGTTIAQNNSKLFWDTTNNRLGVGTNSPTVPLEVNGAVNANTLSLSNTTSSPSITLKNGDAAGAFNDNAQIKMGWAGSPDGSSQYAQHIHTRHNAGPTGNAIDFYLSNGTANNTITSGSTRAMSITSPGNIDIPGKITLADPSGNVTVKGAGFVNSGVAVTLGDIQVIMATGSPRSLQIRTTGSSFTSMISAYSTYGGSQFTYFSGNTQTINGSYNYIGTSWGFGRDGDVAYYFVRDTSNSRFWRITLMVGGGYENNFISIERML